MRIKIIVAFFLFSAVQLSVLSFGLSLKENAVQEIRNEIIKNYTAYSDADIEIYFSKNSDGIFSEIENDARKISFKADLSRIKKLSSNSIVPLSIFAGGKFERKENIQAKIKIFKKVISAQNKIKKGALISASDLAGLNKDILTLPSSVIFDSSFIVNKESKTFIPQGVVILDWMVRGVPIIREGDIVEVKKKIKGITVSSKAVAEEDGYLKNMIRMKNADTKKIFKAVVINEKQAEVP